MGYVVYKAALASTIVYKVQHPRGSTFWTPSWRVVLARGKEVGDRTKSVIVARKR